MRTRQTIRLTSLERHVHAEPYVALVLAGGYEEAGDNGRFAVRAGSVMFHDAFEAHLDRFSAEGAVVLNLRLRRNCMPGIATVSDPDWVARLAERSREEAAEHLLSQALRWTPLPSDWPDELAAALMRDPCLKLAEWGERHELAPWTISRGFAAIFGTSPEAFRARVRTRQALRWIGQSAIPLAAIAAKLGFSDQAHMSRSVRQLTGYGPRAWRSANGFKTQTCADSSMR
ncbi:MAG TPA: helix-turn-helix transcriptional regulator [Terriglobales bacterium]|nr:helix-turn-helix transcriptional regulator [Terriglobales bacterium]